MATRKKRKKVVSRKPKVKAKPRAKKPARKVKRVTTSAQFDDASTQQLAVAEIIGDIEARMALDRIGQ